MSGASPSRLVIELGASRALAAVLVVLHAGAGVIAVTLPLGWYWRLALLALVAVSLWRALVLHAWRRAPAAVVGLAVDDEDTCALRRRTGAGWEEGRLLDCWVHPRLALLTVRLCARRRAIGVVIPADAAAAEPFRRLRVRLRLRTSAE